MAQGQQASAVDMAVEGVEDEEEEDLEAKTSMEAVGVADTAATTRATDAVVVDSTASATIATRTDTCGRAEVKGMGKAMFKGADGKMVGLKNVLWVPNLAANLISVRRRGKWQQASAPRVKQLVAVMARTVALKENESKKCNLGGNSKLGEHEESDAASQKQHKGEENPKAAADEEYGESMWGTIGEPTEVLGCPTCMQAKFTHFLFSSSEATAKAPLDEVVMDVLGPLNLGDLGAEYFLTIVDIYTRMTWEYVLSKKSDVAETVKIDCCPWWSSNKTG
ncbi:unnamed protein product [Closterium sp. NIES-53]